MNVSPSPEHEWLREHLVGEWTYDWTATSGTEGESQTSTGKEVYRPYGDFWVIGELTATMPDGSPMTAITTLGYDAARARFMGTWVGTCIPHMFVYDGTRDLDARMLTLEASGPSFTDPTVTALYQDVLQWKRDDERLFYSQILNDDGSWRRFLEGNFRRG